MKYFNKYNDHKPVNEKVTRDFDIGVLDILRPLFSSLGRVVSRKRLRSIANAYDSYLSIVYKQYLSNKKLNIPEDKVDTFNYRDLNDTLTVKPISKEGEDVEILIDDENLNDILNDGQVNDDTTSGLVNDEPLEISVDPENTEVKEIEPSEAETDSKDDDDLVEIELPAIETPEGETETEDEPEGEKTELEKEVDNIDSNNDELIQKAKKYNKGHKIKNPIINGERVDISELGIKYDDSLSDEEKSEIKDLVTSYANNQIIKELLYAISETEKEIKSAKADYIKYKEEKKKYGDLRRNTTGSVRKKYEEEINRYAQMIEDSDEEIDGASQGLEELKSELNSLYAKNGINESNNWTGSGIYSSTWTEEDMKVVTARVNPYKLIELSDKADIIIDNANDRSSKKLKNTWKKLKNDIHQRWYYIYDINALESTAKANKESADKRKTPEEKKSIKDTMSITMAMKEIFKSNLDSFSAPYYTGLENEKGVYFLLNTDNKIFLMERLAYVGDKYAFILRASLNVTEDKLFTIDKYLNTPEEGMTIVLGGKSFDLYKEENRAPIVIFKKDTTNLYSLPMSTRNDNEYIDLVSLSINYLRNGLNTKGIDIDDTEGLGDWDDYDVDVIIEDIEKLEI